MVPVIPNILLFPAQPTIFTAVPSTVDSKAVDITLPLAERLPTISMAAPLTTPSTADVMMLQLAILPMRSKRASSTVLFTSATEPRRLEL